MKYLLKLDKHIRPVQQVIDGEFKMLDEDDNELFYDNLPDYILEFVEKDKTYESYPHAWYLYPINFEKYKKEYWVWYNKGVIEKEEILSEFERESNTEILSINEIQT